MHEGKSVREAALEAAKLRRLKTNRDDFHGVYSRRHPSGNRHRSRGSCETIHGYRRAWRNVGSDLHHHVLYSRVLYLVCFQETKESPRELEQNTLQRIDSKAAFFSGQRSVTNSLLLLETVKTYVP